MCWSTPAPLPPHLSLLLLEQLQEGQAKIGETPHTVQYSTVQYSTGEGVVAQAAGHQGPAPLAQGGLPGKLHPELWIFQNICKVLWCSSGLSELEGRRRPGRGERAF